MAHTSINVNLQTRPAIYTAPCRIPAFGFEAGDRIHCSVFGCFQVTDGESANPYFVVELLDGKCMYAAPEDLQFMDNPFVAHKEVNK